MTDAVAALDCGSNSTRLLIVDERERDTAPRDAHHATQSGRGRVGDVAARGDAAHLRRPERVPRVSWTKRHVARGLLVATSAVRDAHNGEEFLDEARRRTGVDVRILDGNEEATYSYAGATTGLPDDERFDRHRGRRRRFDRTGRRRSTAYWRATPCSWAACA